MSARAASCFLVAYLAVLPGLPARGAPPAIPDRKEKVVRTDRYGDPLPDGAVARLGTVRWRQAGTLSCVAFSADGKVLASGSRDGQVYLWEVATGKELRRLTGHVNEVQALAFSPAGRPGAPTLASEGLDGTVRLWDLATGRELHRLEGDGGCLAFSPAGRPGVPLLASAVVRRARRDGGREKGETGSGTTVYLWDLAAGKEVRRLECRGSLVTSVAFSPDGRSLATGHVDAPPAEDDSEGRANDTPGAPPRAAVRLWDVGTGRERRGFGAHEPGVCSVAFSPDGKLLAAGGDDKKVRFWEVATGKELRRLDAGDRSGRPADVLRQLGTGVRLAFSGDGKTLVSACEDKTVLLWAVATGKVVRRLPEHAYPRSLALSPDARLLAVGGAGTTVVPTWKSAS